MRSRVAAAAASGLLIALAFPWPGLWPLAFVALAPLLLALDGVTARRGALLGGVTGLVSFLIVLRWIAPLSLGGYVALCVYLSVYPAAFGAIAARAPRRVAPAAWVALEWLRGWVLGGFSWGSLGYALAPSPLLAQAASVGGVALLSAAVVGTATLATMRTRRALGAAIAIPVVMALHGAVVIGDGGATLRVAVVQADLSPRERFRPDVAATALTRYATISDSAVGQGAELIVWPETAIPVPLDEGVGLEVRARGLRDRVERWGASLVFGVSEVSPDPAKFYNAAVMYAPGGVRAPSYRKRRLVPFGEYTPMPWLFGGLDRPLPGPEFVFGDGGAPFAVGDARVGVLICFEDVFADEAVARAGDADLLVVLTNDGWFGDTGGAQHLAISRLRAIETGRAIARAANTGVSALIDPYGRVVARAARGPGYALGALPRSRRTTPFARFPDLVPLACVAIALAALLTAGRRSGSSPGRPAARRARRAPPTRAPRSPPRRSPRGPRRRCRWRLR